MPILDEAFIDAEKLKEAAKQQAESELLEKFSDDVRARMNVILEAPEDDEFDLDDTGLPDLPDSDMSPDFDFEDDVEVSQGGDLDFLDQEIPYAFGDDEEDFGIEDDEEIEIDFDDLAAEFGNTGEADPLDMLGRETDLEPGVMGGEEDIMGFEDDDEIEIDDDLLEDLTADTDGDPSGWSPRNDYEFEKEFERVMASVKNGASKKDREIDRGPISVRKKQKPKYDGTHKVGFMSESVLSEVSKQVQKELEKVAASYDKKVTILEKQIKAFQAKEKRYTSQLKEANILLEQFNLEIGKQQRINDVLRNASLNERQRNKIVDAISNTSTLSEVEKVFELQESVSGGPTKSEKEKNSLNSLLSKRNETTTRIRSQRKPLKEGSEVESSSKRERWQVLAGIKQTEDK